MSKANSTVRLERLAPVAGLVGLVFLAISIFAMFTATDGQHMLQSYLFAFVLWGGVALGCFGLTLLQHSLQARWGLPVIRLFEAGGGTRVFFLFLLLFIPILATVWLKSDVLYPWANPENVASDAILRWRQPYMGPYLWTARVALFFGFWLYFAFRLRRSTLRQDETKNFGEQQMRANWGSGGLVAFVLSITFAFTDWVMSADVHWFSTMYGLWFVASIGLTGLALVTLIVCSNSNSEPYAGLVTPRLTRDLGNLMLTFTMLWAYTSLSQYLIIWSGNIPSQTVYYVHRSQGWWNVVGGITVLGQFFLPFLMLLSPRVKATPALLARVALWILIIHLVDVYQVVLPTFRPSAQPFWTDIVALLGVGGVWFFAFASSLRHAPLLPSYDPRLLEAEAHA